MDTKWSWAIAVATAAVLGAGGAAAEGKKVCYAFQDLSTGFWVAGHKAIVTTLQKNGVEVVELNGGKDANRQLEQIKDCIAQGADGIILTADDSDSETTLVALAQEADVPIATFNRPPSDMSKGIIVVADNEAVARQAVEAMAVEGRGKFKAPARSCIRSMLVGDLADANAVKRREGFMNVIKKYPDIFEKPAEINTKWNSQVALAGLEAAITADPEIDFIFTSSDFLFPTIQGVLEPHGKWKKAGEQGHVILGGLDGDDGACKLIREGYVDSTGVQDVYLEAKLALDGILEAIAKGEPRPNAVKLDPGFALSQANYDFKGADDLGLHGPRREEVASRPAGRARLPPAASHQACGRRRGDRGRGDEDDGSAPAKAVHSKRRERPRGSRTAPASALRRPARLRILHPLSDRRLFLAMAVFFPDLASPRNLSNQLSNVWPLLAVAIGQTFVIIISGIDLSQGAIMGFVSVLGAVVMTTAVDPSLLGGSPLWGWLIDESGGVLAGSRCAVAVGGGGHARRRQPDRPRQRLLHLPLRMPAFMVTLVSLMLFSSAGDLAHAVAEHRQPAARVHAGSAPATSSPSISARRSRPRSSGGTSCPSSPIRC